MVVFEDELTSSPQTPQPSADGENRHRRISQLQKQLKEKDEYLQTIIDELETTNQDLKSANEELQSTNEEMQSANEELETSKEELQSSNEELTTINTELQKKNEELAGVNNDMFNLLASTEIGTLFLDLDLHLRLFTPAVNRLYNFLPTDIGRPVDHFVSKLNYDRLVDDALQVLATLAPKAVEVQAKDGAWYLVSIKPYRTLENVIDGVVITFVDITEQKQGDALRRMGTILRDSNDAVTLLDFNGKILAWNRGAVQMYGWEEAEALKMTVFELIPETKRAEAATLFNRIVRGETIRSYETQRITRDGRRMEVWMTLTALVDDAGKPVGIATTERDITERNRALQRLSFGNRALKALNAWYKRLTVPVETSYLAGDACRILVEQAGYRLVWIGKAAQKRAKTITPVEWSGLEEGGSDPAKGIRAIAESTRSAVDRALGSGKPVTVRNLPTDPAQAGGRPAALKYQYGAYVALPLLQENRLVGILVLFASEPEAFEEQEVELLGTLSESMALALGPGWALPGTPE
jgi:PAS domain S-box-containing protein